MGDDVFRRFFKRWFIHEYYMIDGCESLDTYNASVTKLRELGEEAYRSLTEDERAGIRQEIEITCKPMRVVQLSGRARFQSNNVFGKGE